MSEGGAIIRAKGLADPRKHDQRGACSFGLLPDRPDSDADDLTDEGHTRYELDGGKGYPPTWLLMTEEVLSTLLLTG